MLLDMCTIAEAHDENARFNTSDQHTRGTAHDTDGAEIGSNAWFGRTSNPVTVLTVLVPLAWNIQRLPLEILYLILEAIDDRKALLAIGCTCKYLASKIRQLRRERKGGLLTFDIVVLHRQLVTDPLICHLLEKVEIYPSAVNKFAIELAGKLYGLKEIVIFHNSHSEPIRRIRLPVLIALGKFSSVVSLSLLGVIFNTFGDLARVICVFSNLRSVTMAHVTWRRGEGFDLSGEPFARNLCLDSIVFSGLNALTQFRQLMSAPHLPRSLKQLDITTEEALLEDVTHPLDHHLIAHLGSLETLRLHFQDHDLTPTSALSLFLRQMPPNHISYIYVEFFNPFGPPRPLREEHGSRRKWFAMLDEVLTSSQFPCLQCVCISLELHPEDYTEFCDTPFPLLKARGILYLNIEIHSSPFEMTRWLSSRQVDLDGPSTS